MDNGNTGVSRAFYTVKQLSALFGKSEDTIRRWKNEGIGREEDNIRLRALEREDSGGRKNTRHLVFSREAVIDFVRANPFLMDNAPELGKLMEAEDAWRGRAIPMPGEVEAADDEVRGLVSVGTMVHGGGDSRPRLERSGPRRRPNPFEEQNHNDEKESLAEKIRRPREEAGFDGIWDDDEEEFYKYENRRKPMSRGHRAAGEREYQRRMKIINFALDTLRESCAAFEKEREDLSRAREEMLKSGMDELSSVSISKVLSQKQDELSEKKEMLEEFIAIIEAEIREE